jgi:xanthosine phosphorylase
MKPFEKLKETYAFIHSKVGNFHPQFGLVTGSGLGALVNDVEPVARLSYKEIPHFYTTPVKGHEAELILGYLYGYSVICMKGRIHIYEGANFQDVALPVRLMYYMGARHILISNAAGSLMSEAKPGDIAMVKDHINFQIQNPLIGPNDERIGPRFVAMDNAYDQNARHTFQSIASNHDIHLPEGVYIGVLGPTFETPAEIRAFRALGADLIGMSTVPEVIAACHCGMKVSAFCSIANMTSGLSYDGDKHQNHDEVVENAQLAVDKIKLLWQKAMPALVDIT